MRTGHRTRYVIMTRRIGSKERWRCYYAGYTFGLGELLEHPGWSFYSRRQAEQSMRNARKALPSRKFKVGKVLLRAEEVSPL